MGQSRPLFRFSFFLHSNRYDNYTIWTVHFEKSIDGVVGIQTQWRRMDGADESTWPWRSWPLKYVAII